jgi:23S rRNA (cytidine1920-2'-O)/16S rRNA (cytidine1409-2'-O)-methyltransferase
MKSSKCRLDQALVDRDLVASREKAVRLILAGQVRINGHPAKKASDSVKPADKIEVLAQEKFVSRGGYKLEAALSHFKVDPAGKVCLDIGASTGGFTDCLLQAGASRVFAVDVGENQLDWKLRSDPRVKSMEGVNARNLKPADIGEPVDLVTADVSFISLDKILPAAAAAARPGADLIVLIKPQFEAGREQVGKGGVVRDSTVHEAVIQRIRGLAEQTLNLAWAGVIESPLRGPAGNKEFLAHLRRRTA